MGRTSDEASIDQARMRELMQSRARQRARPAGRVYETPGWVDHATFVLPDEHTPAWVSAASPHVVPRPRVVVREPMPAFERPPTPEVDFPSIIRRADLGRQARLLTVGALLVAVLALVGFQATAAPAVAALAVLAAAVAIGGAVTRIVLQARPVPYRQG